MTTAQKINVCARQLCAMPDQYQAPKKRAKETGWNRRKARQLRTPKGVFDHYKLAAEAYDVRPMTLLGWVNAKKEGFGWVEANDVTARAARRNGGGE